MYYSKKLGGVGKIFGELGLGALGERDNRDNQDNRDKKQQEEGGKRTTTRGTGGLTANIWLAAERADGAGMDWRAAAGAEALKELATDGTVATAHRIGSCAVGRVKDAAADLVGAVARALRVGAEPRAGRKDGRGRWGGGRGRGRGSEIDAEPLRQLLHHFAAKLGGLALLEHGKR